MNRYHEYDGRWWFAVEPRTFYKKTPQHFRSGCMEYMCALWKPLESVEITDALACSRADVGPVFIAAHGGILPLFAVCKDNAISYLDDEDEAIRVPLVTCHIAHPDELRAVGLWDD